MTRAYVRGRSDLAHYPKRNIRLTGGGGGDDALPHAVRVSPQTWRLAAGLCSEGDLCWASAGRVACVRGAAATRAHLSLHVKAVRRAEI